MKRGKTYDWIPLWRQKWLWGSTRLELNPAERSVWIDLLCIAGNDDGHIRANETTPYGREQLAGMLCIPVDLLNETIGKCLKYGKLKEGENGTLFINSWDDYQITDRYRRMLNSEKEEQSSGKPEVPSRKAEPIHKTNTETNTDTDTDTRKKDGRKIGPLSESEIEEKFKEFWSAYPREGRLAKKESRLKFGALAKRGELAEFVKGFHGYLDYLKHQRIKNRFEQRPMYAKTFLNGRWQEFVGFKFEPEL